MKENWSMNFHLMQESSVLNSLHFFSIITIYWYIFMSQSGTTLQLLFMYVFPPTGNIYFRGERGPWGLLWPFRTTETWRSASTAKCLVVFFIIKYIVQHSSLLLKRLILININPPLLLKMIAFNQCRDATDTLPSEIVDVALEAAWAQMRICWHRIALMTIKDWGAVTFQIALLSWKICYHH